MFLKIDQKIFTKYPTLIVGVVVAREIDNAGSHPEITGLLQSQESNTKHKYENAVIAEIPNVSVWRETYRSFSAKPKDYPSSIENLIKRVVNGEQLHHINKLVDLYNYISLKYAIPVGGEDLDKIAGDVVLTFATANEKPIVLLGESEARAPGEGEVIYKDDNGAICRRWNWKEAERTKLTENTKNVVLVIESQAPVHYDTANLATQELASLVTKYCYGSIRTKLLDTSDSVMELA